MKKAGVYVITNTESGKVYIGSTVDIRQRWHEHRSQLHHGVHHNLYLQHAWDKYGEDAFEFGVLGYLENQEELHLAEQFWMDVYREEGRELYNFGLAARNANLGRSPSKETRHKISKANSGAGNSFYGKRHSKEARRKMSKSRVGKHPSEATRRKLSKPHPAFVHRETGEIIPAGMNLAALCREHGLDGSAMCKVVHGKASHHKGWAVEV